MHENPIACLSRSKHRFPAIILAHAESASYAGRRQQQASVATMYMKGPAPAL